MAQKGNILFAPLGGYAFEQQLATARYFASHGDYKPHFLLISCDDHPFITNLDKEGFSYLALDPVQSSFMSEENGNALVRRGAGNQMNGTARHVKRWILRLPMGASVRGVVSIALYSLWTAYQLPHLCRDLWLRKRHARKIIRPLAPRCAIVSQERAAPFLPVLKALRDLGVPVILMPPADSSPDGSALLRRDGHGLRAGLNPRIESNGALKGSDTGIASLNRWMGRWMPSQVYASRWGRMLFTSPAQILAFKITGMLPRSLWYQGTTFADYFMISGADEEAMYLKAGGDTKKLLHYGSHELDVLHDRSRKRAQIRDHLIRSYRLHPDRRIMIMAPPPLWEHQVEPEEIHWELINKMLAAVSDLGNSVLVSLHPKEKPADYAWIEEKYPVRICAEPLKEILPAADLYVSTYSSTLRWAVALGIPAINLDPWGYCLEMFTNLDGFQTVTRVSDAETLLSPGPPPPQGGLATVGTGTAAGRNGVVIDGKAKERLLRFVNELAPSSVARGRPSQ